MNKQDKDKAKEIAKEYGINFPKSHSSAYPLCYKAALDMAAWKEQQMIEKAVSWIGKNCIKYNEIVYFEDNNNVQTHIFHLENFIDDFKKYMEEN